MIRAAASVNLAEPVLARTSDEALNDFVNGSTRQILGDLVPRSIQDILDHADELAERLENCEPEPGDGISNAVEAVDTYVNERCLTA